MITESVVNELPSFFNHASARIYFKRKYQELFVMRSVRYDTDDKVYVYHLVSDKQVYIDNFKLVEKGKPYDKAGYERSYQELEITESGYLKFIK